MSLKKPEVSSKWWDSNCPSSVDGKKVLAKALAKAEKALAEQEKKGDERSGKACVAALNSLPKAINSATKECDKKKDKDVIAALKQLQKLVDDEVTRVQNAVTEAAAGGGEANEEENDDKLFEKEYVHKLIKLVKSSKKELNFCFGLDMNAPEACQLLLHRKKSSEMLFKILKKTKKFPNRLMTYGTARPDTEDGSTLVFELDPGANIPPGKIVRIARKMFQQDKKLRFKKLKVVAANGQTFDDSEPDAAEAEGGENTATATVTPEQKAAAREGIERIERELRRMAAELNINV